ncbi:hypothetical protein V2H77_19695 [Photorhabdus sp. P32]|uniref:hypothetical protein n=1 Tax=Photorhabdus sp. P32 TaxID=3117549 RepID=UPI00311ACBFA
MPNLEELYCCVDDFCQQFIPLWHQQLIANENALRLTLTVNELAFIFFGSHFIVTGLQ